MPQLIDTFAPFRKSIADLAALPAQQRQARAQEQQGQLRGLQIEQAQGGLADIAQQHQERAGLQTAITEGQKQGLSPERASADYYKSIGRPEKAQEIFNSVLDATGKLADLDPQRAQDFFNEKIGGDLNLGNKRGKLIEIESPGSGEVLLYDTEQRAIVDKVPITAKPETPTSLQKNLIAAGIQPGTPEFKQAILQSMQKPGEIIEVTPEGGTKITRGGSIQQQKFAEKKQEKEEKRAEANRQKLDKINLVVNKVDEALAGTGLLTTGLLGTALGVIPGTAARDLKGSIDTIKANLGFTQLQQMREASPTGGALGQVSERELTLLNSAVASLDPGQSPETVRRNLEQVRDHFQNWKKAIDENERRRQFDAGAEAGETPQRNITTVQNPTTGEMETWDLTTEQRIK